MNLETNIKEWVKYDNLINDYNSKIKDLKNKKSSYEENIENLFRDTDKYPIVQISDGLLKFTKQTTPQPLSFKYIESSLSDKLDKKDIDNIITILKNKRNSKENFIIKRFYK